MSQLKPMIIVMLMLTSALAGCTGTDTTDLEQQIADLQQSNDEMNETINQQNQANTELQTQIDERNTEIATLNSNVVILHSSILALESCHLNKSINSEASIAMAIERKSFLIHQGLNYLYSAEMKLEVAHKLQGHQNFLH